MMEPERTTRSSPGDAAPGKGPKRRATIRRGKAEAPSGVPPTPQEPTPQEPVSTARPANGEQRSDLTAKIQERAYALYQACGCQQGHELDHWLEAERQVKGTG
ncbi:MAG TPA: DUF2934 domain-containing protein [Nitrospira sp.]|nr:DUF2934 domain-containing protein [Nitrospira sp.]